MIKLKEWFFSHNTKDQKIILSVGFFLIICALYLMLSQLHQMVDDKRQRVSGLERQLVQIQSLASEAKSLQGTSQTVATDTSTAPYLIVDKAIRSANLTASRIQPNGNQGVKIQFEDAPFDKLVVLLDKLQHQNGLLVNIINLNQRNTGTVSARITMERSQ